MSKRYNIPSTAALVAFESAARLQNFSRAAEEIHIAQSAVSRYIKELEERLQVQLFIRSKSTRNGLVLSSQGEQLYRYVEQGLNNIKSGIDVMHSTSAENELIIACSHEISHLYLMPKYENLAKAIGNNVRIRLVTSDDHFFDDSLHHQVDIIFTYKNPYRNKQRYAKIYTEGIRPICSPSYFQIHEKQLTCTPSHWTDLTFLRLDRLNPGWATWDDWFKNKQQNVSTNDLNFINFDNYVYLLEAAVSGKGIALGWRGLVERYLSMGSLIGVDDNYINLDRKLFAIATDKGLDNPFSKNCLDYFKGLE